MLRTTFVAITIHRSLVILILNIKIYANKVYKTYEYLSLYTTLLPLVHYNISHQYHVHTDQRDNYFNPLWPQKPKKDNFYANILYIIYRHTVGWV